MAFKCCALLLAAGSSTRFGGDIPKPFILLKGKPLIWYSLSTLIKAAFVDSIYLTVAADEMERMNRLISDYFPSENKIKGIISGGASRAESVSLSLTSIQKHNTTLDGFIAIHDAARPLLLPEILASIYNDAQKHGAAVPGIKVTDTIKSIDSSQYIDAHLQRTSLRAVQTPQIFHLESLYRSYFGCCSIHDKTDDTEIYAKSGKSVFLTEGSRYLHKITFETDLVIINNYLEKIGGLWN